MEKQYCPLSDGFSIRFAPPHSPDELILSHDPGEIENFYEDFYRSEAVESLTTIRHWQAEAILDRLKHLDFQNKRVLEIGCGNGHFLNQFIRRHPSTDAIGIEPHTAHPSRLVRKVSLDEFLADWQSQELPSFDFIIMLDVFEHMPDPEATLRKVKRLMSPGGRLILKVPNKNSILYRVGKLLTQLRISLGRQILTRIYQVHYFPPHYYYYNKPSLAALLARHSWTVDSADYVSELPRSLVWKRMWGLSFVIKCALYPLGLAYSLVARGPLQDGLLMIARLRS